MMKKVVLSAIFLIFAGTCFAKTPEIVNPPKPHAKFKWLLVVEHTLYPGHTHYLYTDKYHILKEPDGWIWILPEGRYEAFSADKGEAPQPDTVIPNVFHSVLLAYPEVSKHTIFLRSEAPKPLVTDGDGSVNTRQSLSSFMNFWTKRGAKEIKINPKKAKIIFR